MSEDMEGRNLALNTPRLHQVFLFTRHFGTSVGAPMSGTPQSVTPFQRARVLHSFGKQGAAPHSASGTPIAGMMSKCRRDNWS
ncbi:hypothetical protein [Mesorhizobium sp. WSM3866]|uniref:hypothetical protein n=1 Tax=Mesorhizobium sp. WSM3866 TaxID=422271 RepID=UPI001140E62C|nr:hypothetical protein [Mesorhizobium sp. WSM3866]